MLRTLVRKAASASWRVNSAPCIIANPIQRLQTKHFSIGLLPDGVNRNSDTFAQNSDAMERLLSELQSHINKVLAGGGEAAVKRNRSRNKLLPRERIDRLLDPGSSFLEFSQVPFAISSLLNWVIYLVDSGGAFLPKQAEVFPDKENFGRIFYNQATMSAQGIPQIALVLGSCTAGGAYIPAMADESVMVKGNGTIFLAGPPLVKAATGEEVSAEDLGGATVHCKTSGVSDYFAQDEMHGLALGRNVVKNLHLAGRQGMLNASPSINVDYKEPLYDVKELRSIAPVDHKQQFDVRSVIARIVDGSEFDEFKKLYGTTLVTGFARIFGQPVGILGNNGILFNESALKGTHFIELCSQRNIPLVFLQNITGFMVHDPTLSFHYIFYEAFLGAQAAGVLSQIEGANKKRQGIQWTKEEEEKFKAEVVEAYEREGNPYYSTARLWDDGIIDPADTRKILGLSISASMNHPLEDTKYGVFRM
ncbi:methylcrotonoyl-CoA carboxylase beta chain, mitochondrial [Herrania umbratica]|uniref:methylcrotonoyl-CoA carboxylase n=1 Tax=Herrania umbratica TaxID=108875 RepID=A0A6J1BEU2_9ROSI|nr:methylcrotonoyl-CoA carboxylase beta chain, mitochondrial [Herrania umbratica]